MGNRPQHQRAIKIADFELPRGAITIEALMAMPRESWGYLRAQINLRWASAPEIPLARCRLCEGPVFIRTQATGDGDHTPMFVHYSESKKDCPWHEGKNLRPDDARAAQYQGHQESALHRRLCQIIEELAKADARCTESSIDTYLRPAIHSRGRWPDVYLNVEGLGQFALEVQLAKPFAPEIAARHIHYDREGVKLLWIFNNLEEPLPQGFHDVITMQRGNAFLFDDAAEAASIEQGKLVLQCYLEDGKGGWIRPRLVMLDDLDPSARSAFVEDCRSKRINDYCKDGRARWWAALQTAKKKKPGAPFYAESFEPAWAFLRTYVPELSVWKEDFGVQYAEKSRAHLAKLFAILCSIAHSVQSGIQTVYITNYHGDGALLAMLNSKLSSVEFQSYADLIEIFLRSTPLADLLARKSLQKKLVGARAATRQVDQSHPVWRAMARLFPEILDNLVRTELAELGQLPRFGHSNRRERAAPRHVVFQTPLKPAEGLIWAPS